MIMRPGLEMEVIVYANSAAGAGSTEQWRDDPGRADLPGAAELVEGMPLLERSTVELPTAPYTLLPESEWRLKAEYHELRKTRGRLRPLIHTAWRQQVRSKALTQPLLLRSADEIARGTPVIDGTIQVSVQRYLHLNLDLTLREARGLSNTESRTAFSPAQPYRHYRFTSQRKMKSGDLHYIDHPKAGMLILVSRYELPEVESLSPDAPLESAIAPDSETTQPEDDPATGPTTAPAAQ